MKEQTRNALNNVKFLMQAYGGTMKDIVKVVIYMRNLSKFGEMDAVYREYFEEGEKPARMTVQALSPVEKVDVEVDVDHCRVFCACKHLVF